MTQPMSRFKDKDKIVKAIEETSAEELEREFYNADEVIEEDKISNLKKRIDATKDK